MFGLDSALIEDVLINDANITDKLFVNQRPDQFFDGEKNGVNIKAQHCTFANIGFKKSKLIHCDFSHSVFIGCYFKRTIFEHVTFHNTKFINCKFDRVTLICCDFRYYPSFEGCIIEFNAIYPNLPTEHNLRFELCRNLAIESIRLWDSKEYKKFFNEQKSSSEKHYIEMFKQNLDYYKTHYGWWDRIIGLYNYILSKIDKYLWGYGEKIKQLLSVILIVISTFAIFYYNYKNVFKENGTKGFRSISIWESFYVSSCNFFTITSDFTSSNPGVRFLTSIEGFVGLVLMGFFVAALFRYINRR
jgi:hypothetical protein